MTLEEMRQMAGLANASTLRRAIKAGTLVGILVGTTYLVERAEAERWIKERRRGPPATKARPAEEA